MTRSAKPAVRATTAAGIVYTTDAISAPVESEYPWDAAWDTPLSLAGLEFAKEPITLMVHEWYMHPSGRPRAADSGRPTGSGNWTTLEAVAAELSRRLTRIFFRDPEGRRPVHGSDSRHSHDLHRRDLVLFPGCFDWLRNCNSRAERLYETHT